MANNFDELNQLMEPLFSISHDGLAIVDNDGNILKSNGNFNEILSIDKKQERQNIINYIKNFIITQEDTIYDIYDNLKIQVKVKPMIMGNNTLYIVDIIDYNKDGLLKKMYESVIYTLTDGIVALDVKGRVRVYNDAQGKLEGYSPNEAISKKFEKLYKLTIEESLLYKTQTTKKYINDVRQIYYTQKGHKIDAVTSVFPLFYKNKLIGSAAVVRDFTQMQKLIDRNIEIEKQLVENLKKNNLKSSPYYNFNDIVTKNKELLDLISFAKLASVNDSNVIIYGETGTGKELFSQSIHAASYRKNKPFMALNCAAIPETLLESLLFGTTKGAFTGSVDKAGLFEQADGGTLFLDEINSMPMMLQSKLLRILESKQVTRLGDDKSIPADVRIISSFNQNPMEAVEKGKFRSDLFFRLSVVYLSIPPLRNRIEDIDLLCDHFIKIYNNKLNKNVVGLSDEVKELFYNFEWPGNVRQLKNAIESSMNIIGDNCDYIEFEHLPKHIIDIENIITGNSVQLNTNNNQVENNNVQEQDNNISIFDKIKLDEYNQVIKYINQTNGNIAQAAKLMGISRQKLHYRIKKYNIK